MSRLRVVNVLNQIVVIVYVVDHLIGVVVVSLVRSDRDHSSLAGCAGAGCADGRRRFGRAVSTSASVPHLGQVIGFRCKS